LKKAILNSVKTVVPLMLGAFLIYLPYSSFSPSERSLIFESIKEADYFYVTIGVILAFLSHLSRAWRWNYMLSTITKKPSFLTNVVAIGAGYAINLIIPRGGEIARAGVIKKSNNIPMDKAIGTIIAERVLDMIILLAISAVALFLASEEMLPFFTQRFNQLIGSYTMSQLAAFALIISLTLIVLYWIVTKARFFKKLRKFVKGIKEGFSTIWKMEKKWSYLLHTLFIWTMYVLMFYVTFFSLEGLRDIGWAAVLCAFVAGSFAVAFVNGGFGAYPYLIAQVLMLFGYQETLGTSIGWILWLSQTALVIVYGSVSLIMISINKNVFLK
jgi:hypothetical protein